MDKCKTGLGYNGVPPPYTGTFMPPKPNFVYPSLDDFVDVNETVSESVIEKTIVDSNEPKTVRNENGALNIKDLVSKSIENLIDLKVKVIRCDNETEFKNMVMNQFCEMKGVKRKFSVARTPWLLVIKPHNKIPYEFFLGRKPALSFMRSFGCPVTILNTIDHLGKFDGKADEGFFIGYSTNSNAFRVFNSRTRIVEENLHVKFSENIPNIVGSRPNWLFDIDALTKSMNYKPVVARNQSNGIADPPFSSSSKDSPGVGYKPLGEEEKKDAKDPGNEDSEALITEESRVNQEKDSVNSTNTVNAVSSTVNAASNDVNAVGR
nr:hypothetical protein [Tanacetum cinerariifolium]